MVFFTCLMTCCSRVSIIVVMRFFRASTVTYTSFSGGGFPIEWGGCARALRSIMHLMGLRHVDHGILISLRPCSGSVAYYHRTSFFPQIALIYFGTKFFSRVMRKRMGLRDDGGTGLGLHSSSFSPTKKCPPQMLNLRNAHSTFKSTRFPGETWLAFREIKFKSFSGKVRYFSGREITDSWHVRVWISCPACLPFWDLVVEYL